ncbi:glycoside hydrolase family 5 protein [Aquabacterium sp.]|uniref:glycoside hydrolase family 5 protein n=1 Tax=Aquabacterium sp. TaxID=1872578 RepID=UPI002C59143F|nr:glycoside hydrolase family 5 protein [Aquabacterium sp.]HSW08165.1 glycoside hydrolase family 5 protein [Aquabacterium sp.]
MKIWSTFLWLLCGLAWGPAATAQGCASGGGATVCLSATGTANNIQLGWTVSGAITGLQVYRDTDSDPNGRARLASVSASARSYTDASAVSGRPYWYWIKFTTSGGGYNSGAATAVRGTACPATVVTPYVSVNGSWTPSASAVVSAGTPVILGPQPASGGSWAWSGCGSSGSAREQIVTPTATCTATTTHTNSCGATTIQAFTITVPGVMRDLTSLQLSKMMSPGWNLGNTLEAIPSETSWGNPMATQALMNAVKAAGFKTVRIPVSWSQYAGANYSISPAWMARVTEVVNYAHNAGLVAIVNIHWDGGWMQPTYAQQASVNQRLAALWTQIANNFKYHGDTLLFAGTNEVMVDGDYGTPTAEYTTVQNSFNQTFVSTVRATGGNNATRHLVVQGFNTNIGHTVNFATLPTDPAANRLFMEVHYYDPYNFTLNTASSIWQWGAIATDPSATETWANEPWADAEFQKMKTRFIDQGVPVIMGEYAAILRAQVDPAQTYRSYWNQTITRSAYQHGLVPVYWDAGTTDVTGSTGLFNRATGAQAQPALISTIVNASQ